MSGFLLSPKFSLPLAALLGLSIVIFAQEPRYCSVSTNHTMCRYPSSNTSCNFIRRGVNYTQISQIVYLHNSRRAKVAAGFESRGKDNKPQPPASNMNSLEWDTELARIAQRWADQCTLSSDRVRDIPEKYGYVGQNVYANVQKRNTIAADSTQPEDTYWLNAIDYWLGEVITFDRDTVGRYNYSTSNGMYTQLVWANTTNVGCGFAMFPTTTDRVIYLNVCNYGAGGNRRDLPIYRSAVTTTEVCSQCESNRHCEGYLCVPNQQQTG